MRLKITVRSAVAGPAQNGNAREGTMRSWIGRAFLGQNRAERQLELLEVLSLGGKRQLMLVRCEGKRYLLAVGGDAVQSIMETGPAECAPIPAPMGTGFPESAAEDSFQTDAIPWDRAAERMAQLLEKASVPLAGRERFGDSLRIAMEDVGPPQRHGVGSGAGERFF